MINEWKCDIKSSSEWGEGEVLYEGRWERAGDQARQGQVGYVKDFSVCTKIIENPLKS